MIKVRGVFQAEHGTGSERVQLFKEGKTPWPPVHRRNARPLTDPCRPFFTVFSESECESDGARQGANPRILDGPRLAAWFERMTPLLERGRRKFYDGGVGRWTK